MSERERERESENAREAGACHYVSLRVTAWHNVALRVTAQRPPCQYAARAWIVLDCGSAEVLVRLMASVWVRQNGGGGGTRAAAVCTSTTQHVAAREPRVRVRVHVRAARVRVRVRGARARADAEAEGETAPPAESAQRVARAARRVRLSQLTS